MPEFLAKCIFLRALLADLMGDAGKKITLFDEDQLGFGFKLPPEGRTWVPWVSDSPSDTITSILGDSQPIAHVVKTMRFLRTFLAKNGSGSAVLRESCRMYFEYCVLKQQWVAPDGFEEGESYTGYDSQGEQFPVYEWTLTTLPAPLAKIDGLFMLAKEVALDCEREDDKWNAWFEQSGPEPEKRSVGRRSLHKQPLWVPVLSRIISMDKAGNNLPTITAALNTDYAELGPFNSEQVRGIRDRETKRLSEKSAD